MEKSFYIVKAINKKARYIFFTLFIIFIASLFTADYIRSFNEEFGQVMVTVTLGLLITTGIVHLLRSFIVVDYKKIGIIRFRLDGIEIEKDSQKTNYQYKDLTEIMLIYGGYKGKMFSGTQSFYSYDGSNNSIRFKHDIVKHDFRFLVPNKKSENWIHNYVDKLIKSGHNIVFNNSDNMLRSRLISRSPAANKAYSK